MNKVRQFFIIGLVALFTAGAMIHVVSATTMASEMALADSQLDESSCKACPDESNSSNLCDLICLTTHVVLPMAIDGKPAIAQTMFTGLLGHSPPGQLRSLDPAPPKSIIQV